MPEPQVGYYVHHHGAGHATRALRIAQALQLPVTLIGSQLPDVLPPGMQVLPLPGDTAEGMQVERFDTLHYAPLAVDGLRERMAMLAQWVHLHWPCVLVVDVSVEVAVLARLCSVPVIYMRQHGERDDAGHTLAYESASALLAPYPSEMEALDTPQWVREKKPATSDGCRFAGTPSASPRTGQVLVICGHGGTGLNAQLLEAVARECPEWQFRVAGSLTPGQPVANLQWLGPLLDPREQMLTAQVVVGSASDSLVGEAASLGCRYIAVGEERPFKEQQLQARRLNELGVAIGAEHGWPKPCEWPSMLTMACRLDSERWRDWADPAAPERAARLIEATVARLFRNRDAAD